MEFKLKYCAPYFAVTALLAFGLSQVEGRPQAAHDPAPAVQTAPTPALTEVELGRLTIIQLRAQLASTQQQLAQLQQQMAQQDYGSAVQKIQASHPGFVWNPQAGQLVAVPQRPAPPAPHTPPAPAAAAAPAKK